MNKIFNGLLAALISVLLAVPAFAAVTVQSAGTTQCTAEYINFTTGVSATCAGNVVTAVASGAGTGFTSLTNTGNTTLGDAVGDTVAITGKVTEAMAAAADSAATNKAIALTVTSPADTTGTNSHYGTDITLTIGNATAGTNSVRGINIANVTGDAQVDVRGISIGTGTTLGTSDAVNIGTGWDSGITTGSPIVNNYAPSADSATTNKASTISLTVPADTTGTNLHQGMNIALTVGNATGGTNTVSGIKFANYTGDAQVNVNAIDIGTSDGLGTAKALSISTGWDAGIDVGSPVTGSGLTTVSNMVGFTRQINTVTTTTATAAQCGSIFTNSGAGVVTLPEASTVLGCQYSFVTGNASNFDVNPADGTDQISLLTNAAGDAIRNATVGNSITIAAVSNDAWHQVGAPVGTWSDVN